MAPSGSLYNISHQLLHGMFLIHIDLLKYYEEINTVLTYSNTYEPLK